MLRLAGLALAAAGRWDAWRRLFLDALEMDETAEEGVELAFLLGGPARATPRIGGGGSAARAKGAW